MMPENKIWVVIPAAGSGQRMQAAVPKQYLLLHDKTILEHTLSIFSVRQDVQAIVVCLAADDDIWPTLACASNPLIKLVEGGASRAESVVNGLRALDGLAKPKDWVLVHDAARPCLSKDVLQSLIDALGDDDVGGILAVRAKDTLKQSVVVDCGKPNTHADKQAAIVDKINATIDRSQIWQAQTPQMFRYKLLKDTLENAIQCKISITDESSALEWAGFQPRLIDGDARNLKVTTPDDLVFAKFILNEA